MRRVAGQVVAVGGTVALTAILLPFRSDLVPLSKGFGFLAVVVVAAAVGGLAAGTVASILGFVCFNFFFIPPYGTFTVARPEYAVVLFVFLGLSVLISALLARATERAEAAEAREAELRTLQELSADLVTSLPGRDTYVRMLERLVREFDFDAASMYFQERLFGEAVEPVTVGADEPVDPHWNPASKDRPADRLPLSVGGRALGLVVLRGDRLPLAPAESRVLRAVCDQLAMILEDERLLKVATEAEIFRQTDEVRRSLLAAVSHDLRSPLAAIKASATDLLDRGGPNAPGDTREALLAINEQADRLNALVANLLDMSRIEAGMLRSHRQTVDLAEIIAACADRIADGHPGLDVRIRVAPEAALVRADPVFLERIVANLLENAATTGRDADSGAIEVDVRKVQAEAAVRVTDHGPGVPQNLRELLFYPFYSLERRGARLGTGLGLAICKGLLSAMDGQIWVEDTPGGGATFAFSLPLAAPQPSVARTEDARPVR